LGFIFFSVLVPLLASPFELNASVAAETRAGEEPILYPAVSERFVAELVTPQVEADLRQERLDVRLSYSPRLVWQSPNALGRTIRPLFLNQATLVLASQPSATTTVSARAFGSYGEPDYTILPQLIAAGQGTVAQGSGQAYVPQVVKILTFSAKAGIQTEVSRRLLLAFSAEANHFRPLLDQPPATMAPPSMTTMSTTTSANTSYFVTRQTTVAANPGALFRLTPVDDLGLFVGAAYSTYSSGVEFLLLSSTLSWRTRRASRYDLRLDLGLTDVRNLSTIPEVGFHDVLSPTGSVEALWHIMSQDDYGLTARLKAGVDEFVDPVLEITYPRATVSGQITLGLAPDWSLAVQGDFSTGLQTPSVPLAVTMTLTPTMTPTPQQDLDETAFSVAVPVRHRLSRNLLMEFGGRWTERAPAIVASDFAFRERVLWAYLTLTYSTRATPDWSGR
jgi:hypothetical protein